MGAQMDNKGYLTIPPPWEMSYALRRCQDHIQTPRLLWDSTSHVLWQIPKNVKTMKKIGLKIRWTPFR
jgi:hypothetical protein